MNVTTTFGGAPGAETEMEAQAEGGDHDVALAELRPHLDARLSKPLVERLAKRGVKTLRDLRAAGGIREAAKALDSTAVTSPLARELEAHVRLSLLPTTALESAALVRAGFTSVDRIADTPRAEFEAAVGDAVGVETAAAVHAAAGAQSRFLSNLVAEGLVSSAYAASSPGAQALANIVSPTCSCDCRDATSPVAYLADLLDYAVKHLRKVTFTNGLLGEYFRDAAFGSKQLERVDSAVDFDWATGSPDPSLPVDAFSVRWTGSVRPRYDENYTFSVTADDGVRGAKLGVDGWPVVDATSAGSGGTPVSPAERSGQILLTAGRLSDLKLEYVETGGRAKVTLAWESSSQAREVIPTSCLLAVDRTGEIDLAFLEQRFHQPFLGFSERCEYMEETLRQVRIACEVIRGELPAALAGYEATWYVEAVYRYLLEQIGTTYEELSKTRASGDQRKRRELAGRLGILDRTGAGVVDHLDELFLDLGQPSQLMERALEQRFGYRATTEPPLDPTGEALVVRWRLRNLRQQWFAEDWPQNPPADAPPFIDPDVVGAPDLKDSQPTASFPRTPVRPMDFLEDRQRWLAQALIDIGDAFDDPRAGFDGLITDTFVDHGVTHPLQLGLGMAIADFEDLVAARRRGDDVSGDLMAHKLDAEGLDFLASARDAGANFSAADREGVISIFAQHLKREMFLTWRNEERARGFTLSPEHFQIRPAAEFPWTARRFRAREAERRVWEQKLRARTEREDAVAEQMKAAVDAAEDAYLAELRNDLLRTWASPGTITNAKLAALTDRLQIDMEAGSCQLTTRVAQAIETIQTTLFGAREGLLEGRDLVLDDVRRFDDAWRWLGSYATWKAAMRVFLHPENALRPTLRVERTVPFDELVEGLRAKGRVSTADVDAAASEYSAFFRDVCSLTFEALARVSAREVDENASGVEEPLYLVLARGGYTGHLYYCTQDARPDWWLAGGFKRSLWNPVPKLDGTTEVANVFSYLGSGGRTDAALYYVTGKPGARKTGFTTFDGRNWSAPGDSGPPVLVASARFDPGVVPATPALAAAGTSGWTITPTDRVILVDVDGDGRKELVFLAGATNPDGTRTVGFVREDAGGLVLDQVTRIAGGWDLPPGSQEVVLRTALVQTPDRYREQLLVTDVAAGELGLLGMRTADSQPAVIAETTGGTVPGVGALAQWSVNVQAQFVSADVDADGLSELIVAEPPATLGSLYYGSVTLTPRENGFTRSLADPYLGAARFPSRVVAVRDSQSSGDSLVALKSEQRGGTLVVVASTLRWDPTKAAFDEGLAAGSAVPRPDTPPLDGDDPAQPSGWSFERDDRVLAFEWDKTAQGGELLFTSGGRLETAVASVGPKPPIAFPQPASRQFQLLWRSTKRIEASADAQGVSWARQVGDAFLAADLNGDGNQELVVVSADHGQVAALARTTEGKLEVAWSQRAQVGGPGGAALPSWVLSDDSMYHAGDVDGDGCEEIVVHAGTRLGVLRGAPPRRSALDLGVRSEYGPSSVKALDVVNQTSPLWTGGRPTDIRNAYESNRGLSGLYVDDPDVPHLDEAYSFVPIELGLRLREAGSYGPALDWLRSVYDYERRPDDRKIAYGLVINGDASFTFVRAADWLSDPLAPHAVAATRKDSYTRYTILALVRCLLDFADVEFTRATSESLPRARELYLKALELLDTPELKQRASSCQDVLGTLDVKIGNDEERWIWHQVLERLSTVSSYSELVGAVSELTKIMSENGDSDSGARFVEARRWVETIDGDEAHGTSFEKIMARNAEAREGASVAFMTQEHVARALADVGGEAVDRLRGPHGHFTHEWIPAPSVSFCIQPNPIVEALRTHAEANLHKLRTCRSIAGTELRVSPYAGGSATDTATGDGLPVAQPSGFQPLPYRYPTLIERTKQLADLARQMEGSMLSAIQSQDHAEYEEMKARHDMALARSEVRLRDLQVAQADDSVRTAEVQRQRATITASHYEDLLNAGMTLNEQLSLGFLYGAAALHGASAAASFYGTASVAGVLSSESGPIATALSSLAAASSTMSQVFSAYAAHERLEQEWSLQRDLGRQDIRLGNQEIAVAQDQARVAGQERVISALELGHAEEVLDFLTTERKDNADLYEWMSGVLEQIYRFFLQQATSMAKLAEAQLAFERQELPRAFIRDDYWEQQPDVAQTVPSDGQPADRHGLTGSERLLRDVTELDDYAFRTEQRKLQLVKTISLAQLDPIAFEQFRATGVLRFATPISLFDHDFPGHYLRLVKRVRTSLIALIPPTQGIHATLSTTGTSRVVIGGDTFETVVVQRGPESVALASPINSTGLFELNPQPEILAPFEGIGVDATWEFVLPKASNLFAYRSIADLLVTLDYTALDSYDYRTRLVPQLGRLTVIERPFMFRHQFADAWYDLHNPEEIDDEQDRMVVTFRTTRDDFPPNLEDLTIRHVALYFAASDGQEVKVKSVDFTQNGTAISSSEMTTDQGVISTRRANGNTLAGVIGLAPVGEWRLSLNYGVTLEDQAIRRRFKDDVIEDILLVISYSGETPPWPV